MAVSAKHTDLYEFEQAIDASGGLRVSGLVDGQALPWGRLQALDVVDSPELEFLDLRECPGGVHLLVMNCPKLMHVALPKEGAGAVVHLDCGARVRRTSFHGLVADFDACWAGGAVALERPREATPLHGVTLEDPEGWEDVPARLSLFDGVEGCVMPVWPRQFPLVQAHHLRHLVVLDGAALGAEARIQNRVPMEALVIRGAPELERLSAVEPIGRVRLDGLPRLQSVAVSGRVLDIWGSDKPAAIADGPSELTVSGEWNDARVRGMGISRLRLTGAARLSLAALPAMDDLRVDPTCSLELGRGVNHFNGFREQGRLTPGALDEFLRRALAFDGGAIHLIRHWAGPGNPPRNLLMVLTRLLALAESGTVSLKEAWRLRCCLMADGLRTSELLTKKERRNDGRFQTTGINAHERSLDRVFSGRAWRWDFPEDLYREGWQRDVALLWACRDEADTQGLWSRLDGGDLDLLQLSALAEFLMQHGGPSAARPFYSALVGGLSVLATRIKHGSDKDRWMLDRTQHWSFSGRQTEDCLRALTRVVCQWGERAMADELVAAVSNGAGMVLAESVLARLADYGHVPARRELIGLAREQARLGLPPGGRPRRGPGQAPSPNAPMESALRAPRSRVLAPNPIEHSEQGVCV